MSRIATPSIWKAVEMAICGAKRSSAQAMTACGSSPSNSTDSSPASSSSIRSTDTRQPPPARGRGPARALLAVALLEVVDQPAEAGLGLGHREVAVGLARAADGACAQPVLGEREADLAQPVDDLLDPLLGHVGHDEVLLAGDAHVGA